MIKLPGLAGTEARILAAITRAADAGQVCPTNPELSAITGGSVSGPVRVMQSLETKGFIRVERFSCGREVTIVATGRTTLHMGSRAPHWHAARLGAAAGTQDPATATDTPTGAELVQALRAEAVRRGETSVALAKLLSKEPAGFLEQLGRARSPKARTVARVRAVIAGEDPGPVPANNFQRVARRPSSAEAVEATSEPDQCVPAPLRVDREPCAYCGVRADVGCPHTRSAAPSMSPQGVERAAPSGKRPRTFEEQLAAVRAGARLVERVPLPSRPQLRTLGGVASGML